MESLVYFSLGSNQGNRIHLLNEAISKLDLVGKVLQVSPFYENPAIGFESDEPFINCCVECSTNLSPDSVLKKIKSIEIELGRATKTVAGYESRLIDIDIIYFAQKIIKTDLLEIPHPRLRERKFVLQPLNDIAESFKDPISGRTVNDLLIHCADDSELTIYRTKKSPQ